MLFNGYYDDYSYSNYYIARGLNTTEEEFHSKLWWETVGFQFYSDVSPDAPWIWDSERNLPALKMINPQSESKPTLQDWNLRGAHLEAERGLMWGYWGTKIGEQP